MKKIIISLILLLAATAAVFLFKENTAQTNPPAQESPNIPVPTASNQPIDQPQIETISPPNQINADFQPPLDRAPDRVTKKTFGLYITLQNSPVEPERFSGYHTGTDFEIFPEELDADVPVRAICSGKIAVKRSASGYGGVLVQNCVLDNESITVIYGHLKLASIAKKVGDSLNAGEEIGLLGKAFSPETDGERKHLHLGIHRGNDINIRGYIASKSALSDWIDACQITCR